MKKSMKFLALLLLSSVTLAPSVVFAAPPSPKKAVPTSSTTRSDAVIFKVHDVEPVLVEGVVTGCDYTVTLYNRTSINFRNFTINLDWEDPVDERFRFDRYAEAVMSQEEFSKYKEVIKEDNNKKAVNTSVTVNAFGADKQISVRSHIDSEKCYLMLSEAQYTVTPCDIVRNVDAMGGMNLSADQKDCTPLFQFVSTKNPEYFGKFKRISLTDQEKQDEITHSQEMSDIDTVIGKIVENMGVSDSTLTNIN